MRAELHGLCEREDSIEKTISISEVVPSFRLAYVALDILGPLTPTKQGNRFLLVMSERYSKLTRSVPLATISANTIAKAFCEN